MVASSNGGAEDSLRNLAELAPAIDEPGQQSETILIPDIDAGDTANDSDSDVDTDLDEDAIESSIAKRVADTRKIQDALSTLILKLRMTMSTNDGSSREIVFDSTVIGCRLAVVYSAPKMLT